MARRWWHGVYLLASVVLAVCSLPTGLLTAALPVGSGTPGHDVGAPDPGGGPEAVGRYPMAAGPYFSLTPWNLRTSTPPAGRRRAPVLFGPREATDPDPVRPVLPCPDRPPAGGWAAAENRRDSGPASPLPASGTGAARTSTLRISALRPVTGGVLGYADSASVRCGSTLTVHLSGPSAAVRLTAHRIGWYGGAGSRLVWRSRPVRIGPRAVAAAGSRTDPTVPGWPATVSTQVDGGWVPGFYLLVPVAAAGSGTPVGPAVPLVVRDDGSQPVLFMASTLTWNAYGGWGGRSLYRGPGRSAASGVADRARAVALNRPLTGSGYGQLLSMDLPVVRFVEQLAARDGLDVGYTTDQDVDAHPEQLLRPAELLVGGHSEYWTKGMYDGLLAARSAGVNLAFLGANNLWWQARLSGAGEPSGAGQPSGADREVVYRTLAEDPMARTDPSRATVLWSSAALGRDPAAVLGQSHAAIGVSGGLEVLSTPSWFTAGTGLGVGAVLPGVVGNEADGFNPRAANPPDTQVLAAGVLLGAHGPVTVSVSYSTAPSGAAVFAAGTTYWACALDGGCPGNRASPAVRRLVIALTRNVVLALSSPQAGLKHPATAGPVPAAALLRARLPAAAIGRYGTGADDD